MLKLASLIMLNPRPILQPNEEEKAIWEKTEKKIMRKVKLAIVGTVLFLIGVFTLIAVL